MPSRKVSVSRLWNFQVLISLSLNGCRASQSQWISVAMKTQTSLKPNWMVCLYSLDDFCFSHHVLWSPYRFRRGNADHVSIDLNLVSKRLTLTVLVLVSQPKSDLANPCLTCHKGFNDKRIYLWYYYSHMIKVN